ncbi:hypothetical protein AQ917_30390 [Burkholderia pseudomallei]|nr:hypothetical protein AQ917_30390 [Burkholderia pseudomallei]
MPPRVALDDGRGDAPDHASHRIASHRIASTDPTPARQVSPPDTTRRIGHALRVRPVAPAVHQALGPAGAASRTSQCARQSPK